jgi:hypothetical protein
VIEAQEEAQRLAEHQREQTRRTAEQQASEERARQQREARLSTLLKYGAEFASGALQEVEDLDPRDRLAILRRVARELEEALTGKESEWAVEVSRSQLNSLGPFVSLNRYSPQVSDKRQEGHGRLRNPQRAVARVYADGRRRCRSVGEARQKRRRRRGPRWVKASRWLHSAMNDDRRVARDADLAESRTLRQKHKPSHGRETKLPQDPVSWHVTPSQS